MSILSLAPVKFATAQVTHSVVEVHKPQCPSPEDDSDEMADISKIQLTNEADAMIMHIN